MLELKGIIKSYGNKRVLNDVSMEIKAGSPVAIVGPNGAGKTTLFSIIAGFMKPDSGEVLLQQRPIPGDHQFGKIAVLPQDAQLDPRFSIGHQLKFFCRLQNFSSSSAKREVERILSLVNLEQEYDKKPQQLSHGMRKRACIAQALIGEPTLILLDEATAGLDPVHAREIRDLISTLSKAVTFMLSSHDLSELERLCQRVYVFNEGKLSRYTQINQTNAIQPEGYKEQSQKFLTLRMSDLNGYDLISLLKNLPETLAVDNPQNREFVITYKAENHDFDIHLVKQLRSQGLDYQQIYNGKTLENEVFKDL